MLADYEPRRHWRNEGLFDIAAVAFSLAVIVGSVFIVNAASMRYRVGLPVASAAAMPAPALAH